MTIIHETGKPVWDNHFAVMRNYSSPGAAWLSRDLIGSELISRRGKAWMERSAQQAFSECRDRELTVGGHSLIILVGVVLDELLDVGQRPLGGRIGEIRL